MSAPESKREPASDPQRRDEFTERLARESGGRPLPPPPGAPLRPDPARSDLLRADVAAVRQELLGDIKTNDEASRERDKELHGKIEEWYDDVDEKVNAQGRDLVELRTKLVGMEKTIEKAHRDEFADVPWYARPSYLKAMGLALAAVVAAVLTSLGFIFGWGRAVGPVLPSPVEAGAPVEPGHAHPGIPDEGNPGDGG